METRIGEILTGLIHVDTEQPSLAEVSGLSRTAGSSGTGDLDPLQECFRNQFVPDLIPSPE